MKKKAKGKTAAKKSRRKKTSKKELDPAQVRKEISGKVKSEAKEIAEAVMDKARLGELAPVRFLLEVAGVYPAENNGEHATEEEDCLAKTLLDRLNIPVKPVEANREEDEGAEAETAVESGDGVEEKQVGEVVGSVNSVV